MVVPRHGFKIIGDGGAVGRRRLVEVGLLDEVLALGANGQRVEVGDEFVERRRDGLVGADHIVRIHDGVVRIARSPLVIGDLLPKRGGVEGGIEDGSLLGLVADIGEDFVVGFRIGVGLRRSLAIPAA